MTIILTTHYLEEAEALADRIGIMHRGKLVALGTPPEIVEMSGEKNFEDAFLALTDEGGDGMKTLAFSGRNMKEILRDPLTFLFGILLPVILIAMIRALTGAIGGVNPAFEISSFAPGMAVFSLTFVTLFSSMLVAGDRASAFLMRLFASPLIARDYILGYSLPVFVIGLMQAAVCLISALFFGLKPDHLPMALLSLVPTVFLMTGAGLLLGTLLSDKQSGGVFPLFINAATLLSGTWFDLNLIGGWFRKIGYALPFAHAVDAVKLSLEGDFSGALPHLGWVSAYAAAVYVLAVLSFRRKMRA